MSIIIMFNIVSLAINNPGAVIYGVKGSQVAASAEGITGIHLKHFARGIQAVELGLLFKPFVLGRVANAFTLEDAPDCGCRIAVIP